MSTIDKSSELNDSKQSGLDANKRELEVPYIFGASVIGPLHTQLGIPCQDACAFESFTSGLSVIAVADGLGSATKSEIGSRVAVQSVIDRVKEMTSNGKVDEIDICNCAKEAIVSARKTLEKTAIVERCNLRDLACTLIVVAIKGDAIAVSHIGDGSVVAKTQTGLELFSGPGESEYANEVTPLTSKEWEESVRLIGEITGVRNVAVFTDGCQRAAFLKSEGSLKPYDRFFDPIFSFAQETQDLKEAQEEIKALLASKKICENSEDDKTLVIATL